jgi:hypothetical protein
MGETPWYQEKGPSIFFHKIVPAVISVLIFVGLVIGWIALQNWQSEWEASQTTYEERVIHVALIKINPEGTLTRGMIIYTPTGESYSIASELNKSELLGIYSQIEEGKAYRFYIRTAPDLMSNRTTILRVIGEVPIQE